jgi:AcrR family transcriptional regulator
MNLPAATPGPRLRTIQKAQTRQLILDAARRLLHQQEISTLNISKVVEEAGVGRQTFYFHFRDKDALITELVSEYNERGKQIMAKLPFRNLTKSDLRAWIMEFSEFVQGAKAEYLMISQLSYSISKAHSGKPTIEQWVAGLAKNAPPFAKAAQVGEIGDRARARAWLTMVNIGWAATVPWQEQSNAFSDEAVTMAVDLLYDFLTDRRFGGSDGEKPA